MLGDVGLMPEEIIIKREAKKNLKKTDSSRGSEKSLKSKNVLQISVRLEMVVDHKAPVAMETSSLQAMLLICASLLR